MTYRAMRCPCNERGCDAWHVDGVANVMGVKFTEAQANAVAILLNAMDRPDTEFIQESMLPYLELLANPLGWKPIATAPHSGRGSPRRYVLVRGPSRTAGTDYFTVKAYHDAQYWPLDPWRGVDNGALSDFGWEPTEWMEEP